MHGLYSTTRQNTFRLSLFVLQTAEMFTFHHGEQAGGDRTRLCKLSQLFQLGLVHFAAVAPDAAPRFEVLAAKTTRDSHILNLDLRDTKKRQTMLIYLFIFTVSVHPRFKVIPDFKSGTYPASGPFVFMLCLLIFRLLFAFPPPQSLIGSRAAVTLWPSWLTELVVVPALHCVSFPRHRTLSGTADKVATKNQKQRKASLAGATNPIPSMRCFLGEKQTAPRCV